MKVNFINDNCNIVNSGKVNMQLDCNMLDFAIENKIDYALVRFYQWYPKCVSLGRNQKDDCYNDLNLDIVKRPSGGRALLHDRELTYCFVSKILSECWFGLRLNVEYDGDNLRDMSPGKRSFVILKLLLFQIMLLILKQIFIKIMVLSLCQYIMLF